MKLCAILQLVRIYPSSRSGKTNINFVIVAGSLILIILVLAVLVSTGVLSVHIGQSTSPGVSTTGNNGTSPSGTPYPAGPTPTPTPTKLKAGKDTYTISQPPNTPGPRIATLTLDPLDPKVNDKQTITAHIEYNTPVASVFVEYTSDNKKRTLPLTLASGTNTNGDWQTTWTVDDTVLYTYGVIVTATGSDGAANTAGAEPR